MGNVLCGGGQQSRPRSPVNVAPVAPVEAEPLGAAKNEANYGRSINAAPTPANTDIPEDIQTQSTFVIGIDFGTTYSGAAYCPFNSSAHTGGSLAEMRNIANNISVVKMWPNQTNFFTEKTPTVLAYNQDPPTWGWSVKANDDSRIAFFKLGLEEDLARHYSARSRDSDTVLGGYLADPNWVHPKLPHMRAVDYAIDYLSRLNHHLLTQVFVNRFGSNFLQNQQLSYVITVPAIWSDKAKELTRKAAINAGIKSEALTLITEPEAAALYCATLCNEVDLGPGDRFLICDAGGGTVVRPYVTQTNQID
jgi:molecular chaperone DnaK (HSP70)